MTITHAQCFVALAHVGTPVGAAAQCGVSVGALLRAIQRLEVAVGGLLFSRLPGPVRLSPLGEAWLPHLRAVAQTTAMPERHPTTMPARHRDDQRTALAMPALASQS